MLLAPKKEGKTEQGMDVGDLGGLKDLSKGDNISVLLKHGITATTIQSCAFIRISKRNYRRYRI
jgi:hypothetical protein